MKKGYFTILPRRLKAKYNWGDTVPASGIYECSICNNFQAFQKGEHFSQCQDCINKHEEKDNEWHVTNEFTYFMSKNMNIEFDKMAGLQVKIADWITEWAGTMGFVYIHIIWFTAWVLMNLGYFGQERVFDPFPFGLLTMIVSLEAIFLATFIMISQNLSSQKSEMRAEHEYQVNLETEKNVAEILALMKEIRKESEIKNETITDTIEEIKETIEEITDKAPEEQTTLNEEFKEMEQEAFEKQEEILESAGIDILKESAPPALLEEDKFIEPVKPRKRTRRKLSVKKQRSRRLKKKLSKVQRAIDLKSFKKDLIRHNKSKKKKR